MTARVSPIPPALEQEIAAFLAATATGHIELHIDQHRIQSVKWIRHSRLPKDGDEQKC